MCTPSTRAALLCQPREQPQCAPCSGAAEKAPGRTSGAAAPGSPPASFSSQVPRVSPGLRDRKALGSLGQQDIQHGETGSSSAGKYVLEDRCHSNAVGFALLWGAFPSRTATHSLLGVSLCLSPCLEREASLLLQSGVLCHLEVVVKFNLYHVMSPEAQPRCDYDDPWQLALTFWDGNT